MTNASMAVKLGKSTNIVYEKVAPEIPYMKSHEWIKSRAEINVMIPPRRENANADDGLSDMFQLSQDFRI